MAELELGHKTRALGLLGALSQSIGRKWSGLTSYRAAEMHQRSVGEIQNTASGEAVATAAGSSAIVAACCGLSATHSICISISQPAGTFRAVITTRYVNGRCSEQGPETFGYRGR